ncbi:MAG: hypothetical protein ACLS43_13430 [Evtepia gabavorous]
MDKITCPAPVPPQISFHPGGTGKRITDLFGIQYPISGAIQWLSKPKLAAAVSTPGPGHHQHDHL